MKNNTITTTMQLACASLLIACASESNLYDIPTHTNPVNNVRTMSMENVATYSQTVKDFLTNGTQDQAIDRAKESVALLLKDPASAQFRNVGMVPYLGGQVVCGKVNAKNSYGGYIGFAPFVAGVSGADLYDRDGRYPEIQAAANAGIAAACR